MVVRFNDVKEFIEELEKDHKDVFRKIVRVTQQITTSKMSPNIRYLSVIATYALYQNLVKLERFCGDLWGLEGDQKVIAKAKEYMDEIEIAAKRLELDVRAGVYDQAKAK